MNRNQSVDSTETLELDSGLSLVPRLKLNLTVHRSDASVKPLDEWQLKTSLIDFLKASFSIAVPEDDLHVRKLKDVKKRKREDPVACGRLFIRELGFLSSGKIEQWKKMVVAKMDGIELSLVGVRFKLSVEIPQSDNFEAMKKEWEAFDGGGDTGYSRGRKQEPDTIVLRGVPSRWFAETRTRRDETTTAAMNRNQSVDSTETLELDSGLSLVPRLKLNLTVHRSDASVKPLDEWQLKTSLIDFLKASFSIAVPEDDLHVRKLKDVKKRKREDPVACGRLFIRELGFLSSGKIEQWKKMVVAKMDGIELSLVGVRFKLSVEIPQSDNFEAMKKEWEAFDGGGDTGYSRGRKQEPDTIVLRGVPSRWFAETRVSSKPSMLVTHTIFATLGKIRNLDVAEDDGIGKDADEDGEDIVPGLQCKIVVRFEDHREFSKALKMLCGRSLQKQGSRLKADYDVSWDKDGIFRNARSQNEETLKVASYNYRSEPARYQSHAPRFSQNNTHSKRFKV
ncbi:hypothetical protein SSX86_003812 [Deinandra increscens subsp. villosa]|uniref:A-kinase anchor protein 17A n=1 Tax=Deinandra increscens subsp. villosa TaxID=3103831 RepID=A0AAP0DQW6_9ASTR